MYRIIACLIESSAESVFFTGTIIYEIGLISKIKITRTDQNINSHILYEVRSRNIRAGTYTSRAQA